MNGNKFSNLKDSFRILLLAFPERLYRTPPALQTKTAHRLSANGFTTALAGQYVKAVTATADVHPEDRHEIFIFSLSQYFCDFPTKSSIQFCFHLKLIKIFHLFPFTANIPDWVLPSYFNRPWRFNFECMTLDHKALPFCHRGMWTVFWFLYLHAKNVFNNLTIFLFYLSSTDKMFSWRNIIRSYYDEVLISFIKICTQWNLLKNIKITSFLIKIDLI